MKMVSKWALPIQLIIVLYLIVSGNFFSWSPIVIACQLFAVGLASWARFSFQRGQFSIHAQPAEGKLLAVGPYRFIRHPMYSAALLLVWSSILGHLSLVNVLIGVFATIVAVIRIRTEEGFLRENFSDYSEYSKKTKRIIPFII